MTGSRRFSVESGIIATWIRSVRDVDVTECVPYDLRLPGQQGPEIVLGKGSGLDNIAGHLEQHGLTATQDQKSDLLFAVKSASLARHELQTSDEFRELARSVGIHRNAPRGR